MSSFHHEIGGLITFTKSKKYLSNIKALNGLFDVSGGGGILATIAFRISIIPIPSYKRK
jgi:hypothetical protein